MVHFFFKNFYLYGSTFKFHGGTSLPKPNLSTPPGKCNKGWTNYYPSIYPTTTPSIHETTKEKYRTDNLFKLVDVSEAF